MKLFEKTHRKIREAFIQRIKMFVENPFDAQLKNHKLQGRYAGFRSINITGDWRALYSEISNDHILFEIIGTHSQLYR